MTRVHVGGCFASSVEHESWNWANLGCYGRRLLLAQIVRTSHDCELATIITDGFCSRCLFFRSLCMFSSYVFSKFISHISPTLPVDMLSPLLQQLQCNARWLGRVNQTHHRLLFPICSVQSHLIMHKLVFVTCSVPEAIVIFYCTMGNWQVNPSRVHIFQQ